MTPTRKIVRTYTQSLPQSNFSESGYKVDTSGIRDAMNNYADLKKKHARQDRIYNGISAGLGIAGIGAVGHALYKRRKKRKLEKEGQE